MCKMTGFAGRSKHTGTGVCVDVYGCYAYTRHHPKQNRPNERGSLSWLPVSRATIWELISRRVKLQWMASVFGGGIMWDTSNPSQHSKKKVKVKHNNKKKGKRKNLPSLCTLKVVLSVTHYIISMLAFLSMVLFLLLEFSS